jgi:hypothetical protein
LYPVQTPIAPWLFTVMLMLQWPFEVFLHVLLYESRYICHEPWIWETCRLVVNMS